MVALFKTSPQGFKRRNSLFKKEIRQRNIVNKFTFTHKEVLFSLVTELTCMTYLEKVQEKRTSHNSVHPLKAPQWTAPYLTTLSRSNVSPKSPPLSAMPRA